MRYSSLYDDVATLLAEGVPGAPQRVAFENFAGDLPAHHWFWNPQLSGGIMVEHGVHFFDIFTHLLGPGNLQWAMCDRRASGQEDKWLVALHYKEHVFASFIMPSINQP